MGAFNGLRITTKGLALQAKAQAGKPLHFNRIAMGDGSLTGQAIEGLNSLISEKKSLTITKLLPLTNGKATVGSSFSNSDITTSFYFRELGVFAQDPDIGEILYCYGNAGANADQIPAAGNGTDKVEKAIDVITIVGNAATVTANINNSLIFVTKTEFDAKVTELTAAGSVTDVRIGNRTANDTTTPSFSGTLTSLISGIFALIKGITGKTSALTPPVKSIEQLNNEKVDKVAGKQLSTEDYSTAEKTKLSGIATNANNYTHPTSHPPSIITQDASNRFVTDTEKTTWSAKAGTVSPVFTGIPTAPTALKGTNSNQLATLAFVNASNETILLSSGTNLNSLIITGKYNGTGLINTPAALGGAWCFVDVTGYSEATNWATQTVRDFYTNRVWERRLNNGIWTEWIPLYQTYIIPGDTVILSSPAEKAGEYNLKTFRVKRAGKYRVKGEWRTTDNGYAGTMSIRLAIASAGNLTADSMNYGVGTTSSTFSAFSFDFDLAVPENTTIVLYGHRGSSSPYPIIVIRNVTLCGTEVFDNTAGANSVSEY
ncbi:hypothetical protein [Paenibacillus sp. NRS-1760]|uniref:hypothetical protein n=1 Tax=Paenibacillus sp. NRS-1760 TaxID=3233902 RepID=UPI003D28F4EF